MNLSTAIDGYMIHAEARSLSPNTINDYRNTFEKFIRFAGGSTPVNQITARTIESFLISLDGLADKTKLNYHTGLSALWTWLVKEELSADHIPRQVEPPKPETPAIRPFSEQDIQLLLAALERTKPYKRHFQHEPSSHKTPNALRNRCIIFTFLDTGLRLSELCALQIRDLDLKNRDLEIRRGKGKKGRIVPVSAKTAKLLWRYQASRPAAGEMDPLFAARSGLPLSKRSVGLMLQRLGKKAGVRSCHPHRFRHTFAINYLRNGGLELSLQKILGHSDLAMVRRYAVLAQADVANDHHAASPVANWNI